MGIFYIAKICYECESNGSTPSNNVLWEVRTEVHNYRAVGNQGYFIVNGGTECLPMFSDNPFLRFDIIVEPLHARY